MSVDDEQGLSKPAEPADQHMPILPEPISAEHTTSGPVKPDDQHMPILPETVRDGADEPVRPTSS
jgi:hypothetical protein